jgi:outer membrane protein OmpA-like peptidoglycan-associated protein
MVACGKKSPPVVSVPSPSPIESPLQSPPSQTPILRDNYSFGIGDVFIATGDGKVQWSHADGSLVRTLDTGKGGQTAGMAFDRLGRLYVTNFAEGSVSRFDTEGNVIDTFGEGYDCSPESVVFDRSGNVYVGQAECGKKVLKFDSQGKLSATLVVATGARGSDWLDLAADQCTMFYTTEDRTIRRFNVCSDSQLPNLELVSQITPGKVSYAMRLLPADGLLLANEHFAVRLDEHGKIVRLYGTGEEYKDEDQFFALNLAPDGKSFWTAGQKSHNVYKFNIETGELLLKFNADSTSETKGDVGGLAVFGEIAVSNNTTQVTQEEGKIRVTFDSAILFDFNHSDLKPEAQAALVAIKSSLIDKHPGAKLIIEGHTDDVGSDDSNLSLSKERAKSVAEWLSNHRIESARLETNGYGKSRPKSPNSDEESRARNRRVEIVIADQ